MSRIPYLYIIHSENIGKDGKRCRMERSIFDDKLKNNLLQEASSVYNIKTGDIIKCRTIDPELSKTFYFSKYSNRISLALRIFEQKNFLNEEYIDVIK